MSVLSVWFCLLNLLYFVALSISSNSAVTYENIPESEYIALEDLFNSTNGENWYWTYNNSVPWDFNDGANPCTDNWQGILCLYSEINSSYYRCNVEGIQLGETNLVGTIPETIGSFEYLTELQLFINILYSSIPDSVGQLTNLTRLDLNTNYLTGTIPASIGCLSKLRSINLALNILNGTLPASWGNLSHLEFLQVQNNELIGSVPDSYGNLHDMLTFNLYGNYFSGHFPDLVCNYTLLVSLGVSINQWTGHLPDCLGNLTLMNEFYCFETLISGPLPSTIGNMKHLLNLDVSSNNFLTGHLPDFTGLTNLTGLFLNNCQFSGPVPKSLANLTALISLFIENLYLTGTLPGELGALHTVTFFDFYDNYLTGPISPALGGITAVNNLYLGGNLISGSIPLSIFQLPSLLNMQFQFSLFSGSLPTISGLRSINTVYLSENRISGPIPEGLNQLAYLQFLFLGGNRMTGNLNNLINATLQPTVISIDVSNNRFTGSIPSEPFAVPGLQSFSSLINCLEGTLPEKICRSASLEYLSLDGLSTAPACRQLNIQGVSTFDSYSLSSGRRVSGTIPPCLFQMKSLISLHLSGNALSGSITVNTDTEIISVNGTAITVSTSISQALLDLSLSNNQLTGTIPTIIQQRRWLDLDLSYNELTGVLESDVPSVMDNETVSLQVNRLSGPIPYSYLSAQHITMLNGNMFTCDNARKGSLPSHDIDYSTYNCGSNSLNQSMYIWIALLLAGLLVIVGVRYHKHLGNNTFSERISTFNTTIEQWSDGFWCNPSKDLVKFQLIQRNLILYCLFISCAAIVVYLPTYAVLTSCFKTYEYEYAWNVSAAFLSGKTPAYVLFTFFFVTVVVVTLLCSRRLVTTQSSAAVAEDAPITEPLFSTKLGLLLLVMLLNAAVVITVNGLYVYSILSNTRSVLFVEQVLIAIFKIFWNEVFVSSVLSHIKKHYTSVPLIKLEDNIIADDGKSESRSTMILLSMTLFSVVVVPWIVTLVISSDCFYNFFVSPAPVSVDYTFPQCTYYSTVVTLNGTINNCTQTTLITAVSTYNPPFSYSYQCSSSLITNYANVYVYMFVIVAFIEPLYSGALVRLNTYFGDSNNTKQQKWIYRATTMMLPSLLGRVSAEDSVTSSMIVFHKDAYITRMVTYLCLFLTFIVGFPPLSVVVTVGVVSYNLILQMYVGRWFSQYSKLTRILEKDFKGVTSSLFSSLWMLLPIVSCFYAFFVFDTLGSTIRWRATVAPVLLLACLPIVVVGFSFVITAARDVLVKREESVTDSDSTVHNLKTTDKMQMVMMDKSRAMEGSDNPLYEL